ncbi:MAG: energy transducer TonB [Bacteroidales bacterium]|nr:energy transducer TonB [Bacteroidales bacterium]
MTTQKFLFIILIQLAISFIQAQSVYYTPAENYGGKQEFKDLIKNEMVYPDISREKKEEGKVIIEFTVGDDGTVENKKLSTSAGENLDREALRLFDYLLWTPARSKGTTVADQCQIEIDFKLKKYMKNTKTRGYDKMNYLHTPVDDSYVIYNTKDLDFAPKPVYENADMKFVDFIIQNMKYPEEAKKRGVAGIVEMFFVIEPSGNISNLIIEKNVGAGCNEEAIRLAKLLKWSPGIKDGFAVRTSMKLSITFNLEDSDNMKYVPANNNNQI